MNQVDQLDAATLISNTNEPTARNNPDEVRMLNLELTLVRQADRERPKGRILAGFPDLFGSHSMNLTAGACSVEPLIERMHVLSGFGLSPVIGPQIVLCLWPRKIIVEGILIFRERFPAWTGFLSTGPNADPSADLDGDGLSNYLEAYLGRSPFEAESNQVLSITAGQAGGQTVLTVEYDRASFAGSFSATLLASDDLRAWSVPTDLTQVVDPVDSLRERVRVIAPTDRADRFFRIGTLLP